MANGLTFLGGLAAFCSWFYRAYGNLRALRPGPLRHAQALAPASVFIPIAFFFLPFVIAREIWRDSQPSSQERFRWSPVNAWWFLELLSIGVLLSMGFLRGYLRVLYTQDAAWLAWVAYLAATVSSVAAAALKIQLIRGIQWRQNQRRRELGGESA